MWDISGSLANSSNGISPVPVLGDLSQLPQPHSSQKASPGPLPHHALGLLLSLACIFLVPKIPVVALNAGDEEFFASQAAKAFWCQNCVRQDVVSNPDSCHLR